MRVLFLLSCLEPAGSETYCVSLAKAWQGRHDVFWISDRLHYGQSYLPLPISGKAVPGGVLNTLKVVQFIRKNRIDVVHSHSRRAHWVAAQAAGITHIPHVTTIHQPLPVHFFSRLFPCLGDKTIAIDEVVADHVVAQFRQAREKVQLVRNGIELPMVAPCDSRPRKRIAILGRLTGGRWRTLRFFLDVLVRKASTFPAADYLIAGRVPVERAAEWPDLIATVNKAITPSTLNSVGWSDRLQDFIRSCDGIVAAGRSGLDSLALEKPVILLGEGGVLGLAGPDTWPEALRTNLGDHLSPQKFYPAILEVALRELLSESFDAPARGRWGRLEVEKHYAIDRVASAVEDIYKCLISRS